MTAPQATNFSCYILLTILIAFLYGLSATEILIKRHKDDKADLSVLEISAGWALLGIISTLFAGYVPVLLIDLLPNLDLKKWPDFLFVVPLVFISRWLFHYIQESIATKGLARVRQSVRLSYSVYLEKVLLEAKEPNSPYALNPPPLTGFIPEDELFALMQSVLIDKGYQEIKVLEITDAVNKKLLKYIPVDNGFDEVLKSMRLDRKMFAGLLYDLTTKLDVITQQGLIYYRLK